MSNYTAKGPKKVIQINEKELQQHLSSLVTDTVQEVLNQVLDAEADEMVGAARYERSADRQDYRSGATQGSSIPRQGSDVEHTQASGADVSDGHYRALQKTGVINRGSFGGDVSCGSVDSSGGRYHRGALGHAGEFINHFEAQSQCVRAYREVAEQAHRRRVSVCIS